MSSSPTSSVYIYKIYNMLNCNFQCCVFEIDCAHNVAKTQSCLYFMHMVDIGWTIADTHIPITNIPIYVISKVLLLNSASSTISKPTILTKKLDIIRYRIMEYLYVFLITSGLQQKQQNFQSAYYVHLKRFSELKMNIIKTRGQCCCRGTN